MLMSSAEKFKELEARVEHLEREIFGRIQTGEEQEGLKEEATTHQSNAGKNEIYATIFLNVPSIENYIDKGIVFRFTKPRLHKMIKQMD